VSGVVTGAGGTAVKEYFVIVFSRDRDRWERGSRYVRSTRPDQDGRYMIEALPAGEYEAIAVETLEPGESTNRDLLESLRDEGARITLAEGETKTLNLRIRESR
jgi:hypothetical protein